MENETSEDMEKYLIKEDDTRYSKEYIEGWNDCLFALLDTHYIKHRGNDKSIDIHFNLNFSKEFEKKLLE